MQHGFLKVAAGSPDIRVADLAYNAEQIVNLMRDAARDDIKLLVLPELVLTGYTCGDLFLQDRIARGSADMLDKILKGSRFLPIVCVFGLPLVHEGKLYNCAAVVLDGKLLGVVPKSHLPNYAEFYEKRHFEPAPSENGRIKIGDQTYPFGPKLLFQCENMADLCLGVEICEDLWVPNPPSNGLAAAGATVILNPSASDETIGKADYRRSLVTTQSARLVCAYLYADATEGESSTDMVFAGHNLIAEDGHILCEHTPFSEVGIVTTEIDLQKLAIERRKLTTFPARAEGYEVIPFKLELEETELTRKFSPTPFVPENEADRAERCESILSMQAAGLKKRLSHSGARTAVIGISGGLDSSLALLVCAKAMDLLGRPRTDVVAVTMPCFGTTSRTRGNAEKLCETLGVSLRTVDITAAVEQHFSDIGHDKGNTDVTFENSQARERTQVLMDIANQTAGLVVGTGDLSELALGWATYNGDHMSMYGVNASVPKTLIRHIVKYVADTDESLRDVLLDILDTPVSPELLPAEEGEISQKTEELVGPYELHDFFLYYAIRWSFSPKKVLRLAEHAFEGAYDKATILAWLKTFYRRFFAQQFKRSCLPDGPKIGSVSLSPRGDWRMPSDASADFFLKELE